jgi:hypothetical protein
MLDHGERLSLRMEPRELLAGCEGRPGYLDGNRPSNRAGLLGEEDDTHPALAQATDDAESAVNRCFNGFDFRRIRLVRYRRHRLWQRERQ